MSHGSLSNQLSPVIQWDSSGFSPGNDTNQWRKFWKSPVIIEPLQLSSLVIRASQNPNKVIYSILNVLNQNLSLSSNRLSVHIRSKLKPKSPPKLILFFIIYFTHLLCATNKIQGKNCILYQKLKLLSNSVYIVHFYMLLLRLCQCSPHLPCRLFIPLMYTTTISSTFICRYSPRLKSPGKCTPPKIQLKRGQSFPWIHPFRPPSGLCKCTVMQLIQMCRVASLYLHHFWIRWTMTPIKLSAYSQNLSELYHTVYVAVHNIPTIHTH